MVGRHSFLKVIGGWQALAMVFGSATREDSCAIAGNTLVDIFAAPFIVGIDCNCSKARLSIVLLNRTLFVPLPQTPH